jgi:flagella basal body P-ring formation protein FlgA
MKFVKTILILLTFLIGILIIDVRNIKISINHRNKLSYRKFAKFLNETKQADSNHETNITFQNIIKNNQTLIKTKENPEFENFDVSEFIITAIKIWKRRPFFVWNFFVEEKLSSLVNKFKELYLSKEEIKLAEIIKESKIDLKNKTLLTLQDGLNELDPRVQCSKILDSVYKNQTKFDVSLAQDSQEYEKALRVVNLLNNEGLIYFNNRIFDYSGNIKKFKLGLLEDRNKLKEIEEVKKEYKSKCRQFYLKVIPEDYKLPFVRKFMTLFKVLQPYFSDKLKLALNTENKLKLFFNTVPLLFKGFSIKNPNRVKEIIDLNINMKDLIDKIRYMSFNQILYKRNISRSWGYVIGLSVLSLSDYLEFFKPPTIKVKGDKNK